MADTERQAHDAQRMRKAPARCTGSICGLRTRLFVTRCPRGSHLPCDSRCWLPTAFAGMSVTCCRQHAVAPQFQSHVMKGNASESAIDGVVSARQLGMSRSAAAKVAHMMSEEQQRAKSAVIASQSASGAAATASPDQQQAAVKAAMVHAWRGVSCAANIRSSCGSVR